MAGKKKNMYICSVVMISKQFKLDDGIVLIGQSPEYTEHELQVFILYVERERERIAGKNNQIMDLWHYLI